MLRLLAFVLLVWLLLLPPFFTGGACTAEFDAASGLFTGHMDRFATLASAKQHLDAEKIDYRVLSPEQCRLAREGTVARCSYGPLILASIPIRNRICNIYRDDSVRVQLLYDEHGQLLHLQTDMKPFKTLPLPGLPLHWAR